MGELLLGHLAAGDVLQLYEEVFGLTCLVADEGHMRQRPDDAAVRPQVATFIGICVVSGGEPPEDCLPEVYLVWMGELRPTRADQQLRRTLEEMARCRIDSKWNAIEIGDRRADRRLLESDLEPGFSDASNPIGGDTVRLVQHRSRNRLDGSVVRESGHPAYANRPDRRVRADDTELDVECGTPLHAVFPRLARFSTVVGMDRRQEELQACRQGRVDAEDPVHLVRPR